MSEQVLADLTCPVCKLPLKHLKDSNVWVCPGCGAIATISVYVELTPDETMDRYMPVIASKVCGACDLRRYCDVSDQESCCVKVCKAIKILEMLFLSGKISLKEACEAAAPPDKHVKITYRLR